MHRLIDRLRLLVSSLYSVFIIALLKYLLLKHTKQKHVQYGVADNTKWEYETKNRTNQKIDKIWIINYKSI